MYTDMYTNKCVYINIHNIEYISGILENILIFEQESRAIPQLCMAYRIILCDMLVILAVDCKFGHSRHAASGPSRAMSVKKRENWRNRPFVPLRVLR